MDVGKGPKRKVVVYPSDTCSHRFIIEAKGVYVSIHPRNQTLQSDLKMQTWLYDSVTYCNNPVCEKVFRATMAHPLTAWGERKGGE